MQTIISILRGINVGKNQMKMADLKAMYEGFKCKDVTTYIQSGNVICKCPAGISTTQLSQKIEAKIAGEYGFKVPVITLAMDELKQIIAGNPFIAEDGIDKEKLHVTFLAGAPLPANLEKIKQYDYPPDRFVIIDKQAYLYCPINYGNTKLSNSFFESKLKVTATT